MGLYDENCPQELPNKIKLNFIKKFHILALIFNQLK